MNFRVLLLTLLLISLGALSVFYNFVDKHSPLVVQASQRVPQECPKCQNCKCETDNTPSTQPPSAPSPPTTPLETKPHDLNTLPTPKPLPPPQQKPQTEPETQPEPQPTPSSQEPPSNEPVKPQWDSWAIDMEPLPEMFGPVWTKPTHKSLMVIPVGAKGKPHVDKIVRKFGFQNFSYMLCHYDDSDWSEFDWYKHIVSVRAVGQMKWWFIKRFVVPEVARTYEYLWLWDDDIDVDTFDPFGYLEIVRKHNLLLTQPSLTLRSSVLYKHLRTRSGLVGRYCNFIEIQVPVIHHSIYDCVWDLFQVDVASGWGIDNMWTQKCKLPQSVVAVIDKFPVYHARSRSIFSNRVKELSMLELQALRERFPGVKGVPWEIPISCYKPLPRN